MQHATYVVVLGRMILWVIISVKSVPSFRLGKDKSMLEHAYHMQRFFDIFRPHYLDIKLSKARSKHNRWKKNLVGKG